MFLQDFPQTQLQWIFDTPLAEAIRESDLLFPSIETVHVLALTLVVGTIAHVDLRLLYLVSRGRSVSSLLGETLPFTWAAFAVAAASGTLLFTSGPMKYYDDTQFRMKFVLLALAGLNALVFHALLWRGAAGWDRGVSPPLAVRLSGALSLLFWVGVVTMGRWVGFTAP